MSAATSEEHGQNPKLNPLRSALLASVFLFLVVILTLAKIPDIRITSLIQGYVQSALDPFGVYVLDQGRDFSILRGFRYRLEKPTIELADQTRIELTELVVSPSFTALLKGQAGASASITQGASSIELKGSGRKDKIDLDVKLQEVDIGKFGVLSYLANLKGTGIITGVVQLAGQLSDFSTLNGQLDLKLKGIKLEEQNIMGFQLPQINISQGTILVEIRSGKLLMKTVTVGKDSDDAMANLTGDIALNRYLNSSSMNLRVVFGLSEKLRQSISIIDSLLGVAKGPDGKYGYKLTGSLGSPIPTPDPNR